MPVRITSLLIFFVFSAPLYADEPLLGPAIEGYGPTYPVNDRDVALEAGAVYRAVFDVATYSNDMTALNRRLVSVARFLNMHVRNGDRVENMDLAVVVHGAAWKSILNNDTYQARFEIDNPNLELVMKLHAAGVKFYICGQTMAFVGIQKKELASPVKVALSAMTMLTVLQSEGYALLP